MNPMPLFAMVNLAEVLLVVMFLGTGLVLAAALVFVALRAASISSKLHRRLDDLERQVRDLRKPPRG